MIMGDLEQEGIRVDVEEIGPRGGGGSWDDTDSSREGRPEPGSLAWCRCGPMLGLGLRTQKKKTFGG